LATYLLQVSSPLRSLQAKNARAKMALAEMSMAQQLDEQIREYLLQQETIDKTRRQPAPISVSQQRRKWERRLGYFVFAAVAVVVFALNEYFPGKQGRLVLIALGSGALAFLGALIYVNGFLWVMEKLGYKAGFRSFKATMTTTGIVFFALWAAWAYALFSGRH
jgi:hypothetical protein